MISKEPTSRELKAIQTKNRIYDCALKLIERDGFDNVAIGDICKAAEVSVGLFYYYFPSKNDIIFELYKRADDYFLYEIKKRILSDDTPGRLREYLRSYIEFVENNEIELIRNLYVPTNTSFIEKGRGMQLVLETVIRDGQSAGEIDEARSPSEWVRFIFTVMRGIIFDWCLYEGAYDLKAYSESFIEMLIQRLKK
ncbi:MAG: TetR/AcrR family transcriptional regulator [Spirochaetales bacterium]|nr:TetR/AcrR family transcriptional regulator [Spirochaetales bacterium]